MQKTSPNPTWRRCRPTSFTLVELLTIMLIISILTALVLAAASGAMTTAARNRAKGEIQAISSALESYKIDNGIYPSGATNMVGGTNANYPVDPSTNGGAYQQSAQLLYEALAGKTNYLDTAVGKTYMTLTPKQLGNTTTAAGTAYSTTKSTYIQDPWNYAYGYSTGDGTTNNIPANGSGFFDLWSTSGLIANPNATSYATNTWISNWH